MSISSSLVPIDQPIKNIDLDFGFAFNSLPSELVDKIFREFLTHREGVKFFSCVQQLNKSFKVYMGWKRGCSIPREMPFNYLHFIRAIRVGEKKAVRRLIKHPEVDHTLADFRRHPMYLVSSLRHPHDLANPFEAAIEAGQTKIFKELWGYKTIIGDAKVLLALAIQKGRLEIVEFLLEMKTSLPRNCTTLAIESEDLAILGRFLPPGASLYQSSAEYCRALVQAVRQFSPQTKQRNMAAIQHLLTNRNQQIDITVPVYPLYGNPLYSSISQDSDLCLLLWNSKLFGPTTDLFHEACSYGRHQLVAEFLKVPGFCVENPDFAFTTAIRMQRTEVIKTLLKSPKVSVDPLLRRTVENIKAGAFLICVEVCGAVVGLLTEISASVRSVPSLLISLKAFAIITGVIVAFTIAFRIIYELGLILHHALILARPAFYLAYHELKVLISRKK